LKTTSQYTKQCVQDSKFKESCGHGFYKEDSEYSFLTSKCI